MKHIMLIACASLLAPAAADAGNWSLEFSYGSPAYKRLAAASYRACREIWVPAYYDTVKRPVVIPARTTRRYRPAVYEWRYDHHGRRRRVERSSRSPREARGTTSALTDHRAIGV